MYLLFIIKLYIKKIIIIHQTCIDLDCSTLIINIIIKNKFV